MAVAVIIQISQAAHLETGFRVALGIEFHKLDAVAGHIGQEGETCFLRGRRRFFGNLLKNVPTARKRPWKKLFAQKRALRKFRLNITFRRAGFKGAATNFIRKRIRCFE